MSFTPIYKEHTNTPVTMFATAVTAKADGRFYAAGQPVAIYGDDMFGPLDATHTEPIGFLDHGVGPYLENDREFATDANKESYKRMSGSVWVRFKRSRWVVTNEAVVAGDKVVYDATTGNVKKQTTESYLAGIVRIGGPANAKIVIFTE